MLSSLSGNIANIYIKYGTDVRSVDDLVNTGAGYKSSATGVPSGTSNGTIIVLGMAEGRAHQFYVPYNSSSLYSRVKVSSSGAWTDWKKIQ